MKKAANCRSLLVNASFLSTFYFYRTRIFLSMIQRGLGPPVFQVLVCLVPERVPGTRYKVREGHRSIFPSGIPLQSKHVLKVVPGTKQGSTPAMLLGHIESRLLMEM